MPKAKPRPLPTSRTGCSECRMSNPSPATGARRSTRGLKDGRFPAPVKVGTFSSAWRKRDIDQWYVLRGTGQCTTPNNLRRCRFPHIPVARRRSARSGGRAARCPGSSARPVLDVAIEALPFVESDFDADLIEHLALGIEDLHDERRAVRAVLSEALALAHEQHREIERLRRVYHQAIEELRVLRQQRADA